MDKKISVEKKCGTLFSLFVCFYLIAIVIFSVATMPLENGNFIKNLISPLCYTLAVLGVFWFNKSFFNGEERLFPKGNASYRFYILAVLLTLGMYFLFGGLNLRFLEFLKGLGLNVSGVNLDISSPVKFILAILAFAVVPAIFEEAFFRGLLIERLGGNVYIISIVVGGLFGLYHLSFSRFLYQFIYGVFLTLLALKGKSVYPAILSHLINNLLVLTLEYLRISVDFYAVYSVIIGAVCFSLFLVGIITAKGGEAREKIKFKDLLIFSLIGITICLLIMILEII